MPPRAWVPVIAVVAVLGGLGLGAPGDSGTAHFPRAPPLERLGGERLVPAATPPRSDPLGALGPPAPSSGTSLGLLPGGGLSTRSGTWIPSAPASARPGLLAALRSSPAARDSVLYPVEPNSVGITDAGVTTGLASYSYDTPVFEGTAQIRSLSVSGPSFDVYSVSFQLNVVVVLTRGSTTMAYWIQDVPFLNTSTQVLSFEDNVWNLSSPLLSMSSSSISGNGSVYSLGNGEDFYADVPGSSYPGNGVRLTYPSTFSAKVVASVISGLTRVGFEYQDGGNWVTYDNVTFPWSRGWTSLGFHVNGATSPPAGASYDAEWVLGGPGGGSTTQDVESNLTLDLEEFNGNNLQAVSNAFSFGLDTAEAISNVVDEGSAGPGGLLPGVLLTKGSGVLGPVYGPSDEASLNVTDFPAPSVNDLNVNSTMLPFVGSQVNVTLHPGSYAIELGPTSSNAVDVVLTPGWYVRTLGPLYPIDFSPKGALPGASVSVSGKPPLTGGVVNLTWRTSTSNACNATISSNSTFSCSVIAPAIRSGWYTMIASTGAPSVTTGLASFHLLTNLSDSISASPRIVDAQQAVNFSGMVSGGIGPYGSYAWRFGDGTGATTGGPSVQHSYYTSGNYTARLSVSDQVGNVATATTVVTVVSDPQIQSLTANRTSADVGQSVTFSTTVTAGSGGNRFVWDGLPSSCVAAGPTAQCPDLPTAGTFPIEVSVTDSQGRSASSGAVPFVVYPDPALAAPRSNRSSADVGQMVRFTAILNSSGSGATSFLWQWPQGPAAGLTCLSSLTDTLDCQAVAPGIFPVRSAMVDQNGVSAISPDGSFRVLPDPIVAAPTITPSVDDVAVLLTASANATGGSGGYRYVWAGIPGCAGVGATITCEPTEAGGFNVTVTVADSNQFLVTSPPTPVYVNPPMFVSVSGPFDTLAAGEVGHFTVSLSGGTGPYHIAWRFPDGARATGAEGNHSFPSPGSFAVQLWANDTAGGSVHRELNVTVGPAPPILSLSTLEANLPLIGVIVVIAVALGVALLGRWGRPPVRVPDPPKRAPPAPVNWEDEDLW